MALRDLAVLAPHRRASWVASALRGGRAAEPESPSLASMLEGLRAEGFDVAHGVLTSRGAVDHVVFGPTGTFAITSRSWIGKLTLASGPRLVVDGRDEHASVRHVHGAAVALQGRLSRAGVAPFVEAIIAVDRAELPRARMPIPGERVTVVRASEVADVIRGHGGSLTVPERERVRAALTE